MIMTLQDWSHFRENLTHEEVILVRKLRFVNLVDILNSDTFSENSLTVYLGFRPNLLELFYLKSVHRSVKRKFLLNKDKGCTPIVTFFRKIVKGSVRIRKIIDNVVSEIGPTSGLNKRVSLTNYNNADPERDCNFYKIFQISKLKNNLQSFIFNFTSQTLYHNAMIAHFVPDHNMSCQRCEFGKLRPALRETISHIFWDCPKIYDIITVLNLIISNGVLSYEELKIIIFLGCSNPISYNIETTNIICFIVMYFIFSTRNDRRIYNTSKLKQFISRINKPLFVEYGN